MKANNKDNSIRGSPASVIQTPTAVIPPIIQEEEAWICPPSEKSLRTTNPIRAIVDPIVASLSGQERNDGKNHISLAVGSLFICLHPIIGARLDYSHLFSSFVYTHTLVGGPNSKWTSPNVSSSN